MKKYVFLTHSLGGLTGNPRYVSNKLDWLIKQGWDVIAFDSTGDSNAPIELDNLKNFSDNRIKELYYYPSWFTTKKKNSIIKIITDAIGIADEIVIESNDMNLAIWGEQLAELLKAKHLIFLTGEHCHVSKENFNFFYKKYQRNELFSINTEAFKKLFSGFLEVKDGENHYWSAMMGAKVEDIFDKDIEVITRKDINIGHLGREKEYFPEMMKEIAGFIKKHNNKTINIIFLGIETLSAKYQNILKCPNVNIFTIGSKSPIPESFFKKVDIVIATAGCASLTYRYGYKVISMDVVNKRPLGVVGFTTKDYSFCSKPINDAPSLSELLEQVIIDNHFVGDFPIQIPYGLHGFDYQMNFVTDQNDYYIETSSISGQISKHDYILKPLIRIGFVNTMSFVRYRMR